MLCETEAEHVARPTPCHTSPPPSLLTSSAVSWDLSCTLKKWESQLISNQAFSCRWREVGHPGRGWVTLAVGKECQHADWEGEGWNKDQKKKVFKWPEGRGRVKEEKEVKRGETPPGHLSFSWYQWVCSLKCSWQQLERAGVMKEGTFPLCRLASLTYFWKNFLIFVASDPLSLRAAWLPPPLRVFSTVVQ